jgi:hypothetical protein
MQFAASSYEGMVMGVAPEEGLRLVDSVDLDGDDDQQSEPIDGGDADLETLRDEFVDAFNARDMDAMLALAAEDIECPDIHGDGTDALAEELSAIWERSPGALLTRGFLDGEPCAVAWLPDEDGAWARAALVCLDGTDGLISLVTLPDDADSLDRAEAEDPDGEEQQEGADWQEWDSGEAADPKPRDRARP